MKKNGFVPILIILVIMVLGAAGYILLYKILTQNQQGQLTAAAEPYKSIFLGVSKVFSENLDPKVRISYSVDGKLYWPVSNGALATIDSSPEIQIKSLCGVSNDDTVFASKMDKSLAELDRYFSTSNFKKVLSPAFSTTAFSKSSLGSIIGYQNNSRGLMCIFVFGSSCGGSKVVESMFRGGFLSCNMAANVDKSIAPQLDALLAFGTPGDALDLIDNYRNFYYFSSHSLIGPGAAIYAAKGSTGWIKISGTQDYLRCDLANKYKVPHQLRRAEKCYDSISQQIVNNPN